MAEADSKTCNRCGERKPLSSFYARGGRCKSCVSEVGRLKYATDPELAARKRAYASRWRTENPEKAKLVEGRRNREDVARRSRAYYAANRERIRAERNEWRLRHPELARQQAREYKTRQESRQRRRERYAKEQEANKAWKAAHPELVRAYCTRRNSAKRVATCPWADEEAIKAIYAKAASVGLQVDHIVPLRSQLVCGLHCEANLQLLTRSENSSKGNRRWPDMWEPE